MSTDFGWEKPLAVDVEFGYLRGDISSPRRFHPQIVLNSAEHSVLKTLRDELRRSTAFLFSVAFVSPRAIALLKQELVEFNGRGQIITSDYLAFNSPAAFSELLGLRRLGIDVRIHDSDAFHPKGYIFDHGDTVTAMIGSANLTENALARNTEWNLKVSAAAGSDLDTQLRRLVHEQLDGSTPLTQEWIDDYTRTYREPVRPVGRDQRTEPTPHVSETSDTHVEPNAMQRDALEALQMCRDAGERRAVVISATGTGKTILSALDVRAAKPRRMLFLVHREQILDRTILEYRKVLGGPQSEFGKLAGGVRDDGTRYLFATIQSFGRPATMATFARDAFDYVVIDEAHRVGASSYRKIVDYLTPDFLLGMTATPERTDSFNVFELFDYNVPYEIRLQHALEANMLSPFHYYGITDVTYDDGETVAADSDLSRLVTPARVAHLVDALETYGQAGVPPRGLIFCARTEEAQQLSSALNERTLRGKPLRTIALTGKNSVSERESAVARLEEGDFDYILTVDVFNEGVDIPSVNQVVMLRQTQSAIVFVQQLGRGLRKSERKEYLVVIDFIGNYANNYLIPIALFGDNSLNKESVRKNLIAAEEIGVLPDLSSVRFDRIAHRRVLESIAQTNLDSMRALKSAVLDMRNRVGASPSLWDFFRFESVDPVVLATKKDHFPALLASFKVDETAFSPREGKQLHLLSYEVLPSKRLHEFVVLRALLKGATLTVATATEVLADAGIAADARQVSSAFDTLTVTGYSRQGSKRFSAPLARRLPDGRYELDPDFGSSMGNHAFEKAVLDVLKTGEHLTVDRYALDRLFTPGRQYTRSDAARILGWPRANATTIYGYKTDVDSGVCANFVTLHKSDDISATTAYEDELLDTRTMRWFTRSRRNLQSKEVAPLVANAVDMHVFVQKDNAEDFFYLGLADSTDAEETTLPGRSESIVRMMLNFREPIDAALFDYFHPSLTTTG
ncbi:DEAD/DEAH box helicase [Aeromicrobium sp.]|uniref:DEAD/DEAH box helicase n=1 Tax=Aeromicrobium sp. TaxID=1871063 RepID=UPI0028B20685|nr:DEAD/DEAH box helicase [Aeromicrobium sp.]